MKLFFVRHGESTANLLREFSNHGLKHPLTAAGIDQSRSAACSLRGTSIDRIYSSPVLRALQTAQILAEELQAPLEIAEALREWNVGIYEGTTDPLGWELHHRVQENWYVHHDFESKMPGGESFVEIRQRFIPFIEALLQEGSGSQRNIVLVGHGGLYTAMLPSIFRNLDHAFAWRHGISYTALIVAEYRTDGLYCISWNGLSFDVR